MSTDAKLYDIRAVAFDMDGLMFDTEKTYWQTAEILLGRRGLTYTEELCNDIMGRPPVYCFKKMVEYYSLDENWDDLRRESERIFLQLLEKGAEPMPGLFPLLDTLERLNIPKAVCTSSPRPTMEAVLKKDKLLPRFQFVITSQDIVKGKPDPEVYALAAQRFGLSPENMLVLEDSVAGCQSARAAGAPCFIVLAQHNRQLDFPEASRIMRSLDDPELTKILGAP